jgi:hypothetical protein
MNDYSIRNFFVRPFLSSLLQSAENKSKLTERRQTSGAFSDKQVISVNALQKQNFGSRQFPPKHSTLATYVPFRRGMSFFFQILNFDEFKTIPAELVYHKKRTESSWTK